MQSQTAIALTSGVLIDGALIRIALVNGESDCRALSHKPARTHVPEDQTPLGLGSTGCGR
ncbi:MAG: hypothetical protein ACFB5Z_03285 [Elainellaceae cyanobacterium]